MPTTKKTGVLVKEALAMSVRAEAAFDMQLE
jgi:hypothetical protein